MKTKRIVSLLLAVLTIMGSLVITVGATDEEKSYEYTNNPSNTKPTISSAAVGIKKANSAYNAYRANVLSTFFKIPLPSSGVPNKK